MYVLRPGSVDFMDGGATDVPILGPMEFKNCISVFQQRERNGDRKRDCRLSEFYFIFYFRPTDCIKKVREKSAIRKINWAWPKYLVVSRSTAKQVSRKYKTALSRVDMRARH